MKIFLCLLIIVIIIVITYYITKNKKITIYIYDKLSDKVLNKISSIVNIKKSDNGYIIKDFVYRFDNKIKKLDEYIIKNTQSCYLYENNYKIPGCLFLYSNKQIKPKFVKIATNSIDFFKYIDKDTLININKFIPNINILNISNEHFEIIKELPIYKDIFINYIDYIKLKIKTNYLLYLNIVNKVKYPLFYNYYISNTITITGIDTSNYQQLCEYLENNIIQFEYEKLIQRNEINDDYLMYITNIFKKQINYSKVIYLYSNMSKNFDKWLLSRYRNYISYLNNKPNGIEITQNNRIFYYIWNKDTKDIFEYGINKLVQLNEKMPKTSLKDNILLINPKKIDSLCYIEPEDIIGILKNGSDFELNPYYINKEKLIL